jgi:hypothetical protein
MPAFTFEKITPPAGGPVSSEAHGTGPSTVKKQRSVIVQILDRFAERRAKRILREEKRAVGGQPPK